MNVGIRLGHTESLRVRPMIEAMSLLLSTWSFSRPEHESAFARLGPGCDPLDAAMHVADAVEADPEVDSVGYGGLPDASGGVSLDALVMRSPAEHGSAIAMTKVRQAGGGRSFGDGEESPPHHRGTWRRRVRHATWSARGRTVGPGRT